MLFTRTLQNSVRNHEVVWYMATTADTSPLSFRFTHQEVSTGRSDEAWNCLGFMRQNWNFTALTFQKPPKSRVTQPWLWTIFRMFLPVETRHGHRVTFICSTL